MNLLPASTPVWLQELKDELQSRGLDTSGLKAVLVERLEAALSDSTAAPDSAAAAPAEEPAADGANDAAAKPDATETANEVGSHHRNCLHTRSYLIRFPMALGMLLPISVLQVTSRVHICVSIANAAYGPPDLVLKTISHSIPSTATLIPMQGEVPADTPVPVVPAPSAEAINTVELTEEERRKLRVQRFGGSVGGPLGKVKPSGSCREHTLW